MSRFRASWRPTSARHALGDVGVPHATVDAALARLVERQRSGESEEDPDVAKHVADAATIIRAEEAEYSLHA